MEAKRRDERSKKDYLPRRTVEAMQSELPLWRHSGCVTQAQKLQHQLRMGAVGLGETDFGAATTHYIIPFAGGVGCFECS